MCNFAGKKKQRNVEEILQNLNEPQRAAVTYNDGPSLVIAGAGSGKTRVLTYKIAYLLQSGYEPYRLLALTFTNKAAREMKERIARLIDVPTAARLWMGTFHSVFSRILRSNAERLGFKSDFTIYDTSDSRSLLKSIIKEMQLDDKIYKPATVQAIISNAKNALITPSSYASNKEIRETDARSKRPLIHEIYRTYWHRCFISGAMDFDDLLLYTNILFRDHEDVLHRYQEIFRYVLVDEYQDTNFAQHLIVNQLCKGHGRICVVGDDAQSIYSFRGASINNILNLKEEYPGLKTFKLEQNYRSTQNIVNTANSLISKNKEQIRKHVFSEKEPGSKVAILNAYSDFEEGFIVANQISEMRILGGFSFNDFAILYRTNAQSRILEESLRKRNIPYRIYGGLSFYQRKEIKDAVSYFRITINPDDEEALKRVINYPARGIGDTTIKKIVQCAITQGISLWQVVSDPVSYALPVNNGTISKLLRFRDLIEGFRSEMQTKTATELAEIIIRQSGLFQDIHSDNTPENISRQENIQELLNGISEFCSLREEEGEEHVSLNDFLAEISLATDQDSEDDKESEKVTMMTVHAAKGLEFKNVIIVGVEEDLFPSSMSKNSEREIEEERRLLYVAITRAEINCILTYASTRFRNGQTTACPPSRFLKDLDPQYITMPERLRPGSTGKEETIVPPWEHSDRSYTTPAEHPIREHRQPKPEIYSPEPKKRLTRITKTNDPAPSLQSIGDLTVGCHIRHERFGTGEVVSIEGTGDNCKIGVEFQHVGRKQLLLKFARFTIIK